jgi:hypothetical protein
MTVVPVPPRGPGRGAGRGARRSRIDIELAMRTSILPLPGLGVDRLLNLIDVALRRSARRLTALEARANRLAWVGFHTCKVACRTELAEGRKAGKPDPK